MAGLGTCGMYLTLTVFGMFYPVCMADSAEVFLTKKLCSSVIGMDYFHGKWKRLLFPTNETCEGIFDCKVTVSMTSHISSVTHICIDYSRMKLYGRETKIFFYSPIKAHQQSLNWKKYPQIEKSMPTVFCVPVETSLVFAFKATCQKRLAQTFVNWMYVYLQGTRTGSVYFLDGTCRHKYIVPSRNHSSIAVHSHIWPDSYDYAQQCTLRLGLTEGSKKGSLCVRWHVGTIPVSLDVRISIKQVYRGVDISHPAQTLLTLRKKRGHEPRWVYPKSPICYSISLVQEIFFEVFIAPVPDKDRPVSYDRMLFKLSGEIKGVLGGENDKALSKQTTESDLVDTFSPDDSPSGIPIVLKIFLGSFGGIIAVFCIACVVFRLTSSTVSGNSNYRRQQSNNSRRSPRRSQGRSHSRGAEQYPAEAVEQHPMLPAVRQSAAGEENEEVNTGSAATCLPPPPYEVVSDRPPVPAAPPAYSDLFPCSRTR